jgi:hypothetical protein
MRLANRATAAAERSAHKPQPQAHGDRRGRPAAPSPGLTAFRQPQALESRSGVAGGGRRLGQQRRGAIWEGEEVGPEASLALAGQGEPALEQLGAANRATAPGAPHRLAIAIAKAPPVVLAGRQLGGGSGGGGP